ncbi:MAG: antitoxin [Candidatus Omnitrophica bacterium]|nr:antitoxin [Candidatus Omnitrophota bacterium]
MSEKYKLDKEEQEILGSYERGEWKPTGRGRARLDRFKKYAVATYRKDKRINIRISSGDLEELQKEALEEGLPYQTFITSILHKYASGRLRKKEQYI